jgi:hypothetical protein
MNNVEEGIRRIIKFVEDYKWSAIKWITSQFARLFSSMLCHKLL